MAVFKLRKLEIFCKSNLNQTFLIRKHNSHYWGQTITLKTVLTV